MRSGFQCCFVLFLFVCEKLRTPVRSGDLVALFEPSEGPLEALWGHSWGTVGAYPFNMLKKPQSSATAEKHVPAAGGGGRGETLSKQIYLERFKKSGSKAPTSRFATAVPFALKGSVAGFKGLRPPAAGPLL